jgi:hypothetical protein
MARRWRISIGRISAATSGALQMVVPVLAGTTVLRRFVQLQQRAPSLLRLKHDPEKCAAVFRKDHAQSKSYSAMMIQADLIAL